MRNTERIVMLQVIDNQWKDHLLSMDELKQGIGNRAYGQKDPLVEYKKESWTSSPPCGTASRTRRSATCTSSR